MMKIPTKFTIVLLYAAVICLCVIACHGPAHAAEYSYPPTISLDDVAKIVAQAPKAHPRLFLDQDGFDALRKKCEQDAFHRSFKQTIVKQADFLMAAKPVERKLTGRRLLGQSRRCLQRVILLSMAYQLTRESKYAERCQKEMVTAAGFTDWNPSHFLDVAEMTMSLAVGYDWLYHQLDGGARDRIKTAIVEKGVKLPFETKHNGWVRATNNWGQVCHGGLTAGALAVLEDEPELAAKTVHNALHNVTRSMAAFAPNGCYPEGPGYWSYGTTYNVLLIDMLEGVLGSGFGLSQAPGFDKTGEYLTMVTGPSGMTFNYADGGSGRRPEPAVFWFANRYHRPDWEMQDYDLVSDAVERANRARPGTYGDRFFPFALIWMKDKPAQPKIDLPLSWSSGGHVPITVHRSSWTDPNRVFLGLKAGSPSSNHGNMDIGSFVLDADGVRWAMDLGAEGYNGIEQRGMDLWNRNQDSDRWTIFRQMNVGHNTLVIDGQLQVAKNAGEIVKFSDDPKSPYSIVDMSPVYEGQAKSIRRGVALLPSREVLIRDELTGLKPGTKVRWGMITRAKPDEAQGKTITLRQDDKSMRLADMAQGQSADWSIVDTATPRNEWDSPNRGTCMLALEETAPADGNLTITVLLTPGSCENSIAASLDVKKLDDWK